MLSHRHRKCDILCLCKKECVLQIGICVVEKSDFMKQIDFLRKLRSLKINCKGGELVKYEER